MAHILCSDVQSWYFGTFIYCSSLLRWIPLNCPIDFLSCLYWSNCLCGSVALVARCFPFTNSHIQIWVWVNQCKPFEQKHGLFSLNRTGSTVICNGLYDHHKPHTINTGFRFYIKLQLRKKVKIKTFSFIGWGGNNPILFNVDYITMIFTLISFESSYWRINWVADWLHLVWHTTSLM